MLNFEKHVNDFEIFEEKYRDSIMADEYEKFFRRYYCRKNKKNKKIGIKISFIRSFFERDPENYIISCLVIYYNFI